MMRTLARGIVLAALAVTAAGCTASPSHVVGQTSATSPSPHVGRTAEPAQLLGWPVTTVDCRAPSPPQYQPAGPAAAVRDPIATLWVCPGWATGRDREIPADSAHPVTTINPDSLFVPVAVTAARQGDLYTKLLSALSVERPSATPTPTCPNGTPLRSPSIVFAQAGKSDAVYRIYIPLVPCQNAYAPSVTSALAAATRGH